jgi:hypothetical protein
MNFLILSKLFVGRKVETRDKEEEKEYNKKVPVTVHFQMAPNWHLETAVCEMR